MKNFHSDELEEFKKNYKDRIAGLAKAKTEWSQIKPEDKTVGDMIREMNAKNHLYHGKKYSEESILNKTK